MIANATPTIDPYNITIAFQEAEQWYPALALAIVGGVILSIAIGYGDCLFCRACWPWPFNRKKKEE